MKNSFGYIQDMLEHISYIEDFLFEVTEEELSKNKEKEFAIIRSFEVIGEAGKKVDEQLKLKYPDISCKKMAGFRDILIHDYDRIMTEILWVTATKELPPLKAKLLENES
ncbi:HepT-like ribonuclease domain-containing protein [Autumnicola musiva]|uniref:DUF86 domain-containing protein n=1 Tax=Autumnicola musiva TaxID=3075589 RepID=A0ABU3DA58_9FLAO|nr:HepT-like ribonuclease domain-containing protein [Zunongwangia sp. F117]MDT0678418.1 DUF86 domain-containing protein [Zunongwangia sp. F117]